MRRIVLTSIALLLAVLPVQAQQPPGHSMTTPDALKWVDPPSLPPGVKLAILQGDPGKEGLFVYRLKLPAGYKVPPHFHKSGENVTVLSGVLFFAAGEKFDQGAGKELAAGSFVIMPATHPHFAWAGAQETLVQVHGVGPTDITYVNPADDPRKK